MNKKILVVFLVSIFLVSVVLANRGPYVDALGGKARKEKEPSISDGVVSNPVKDSSYVSGSGGGSGSDHKTAIAKYVVGVRNFFDSYNTVLDYLYILFATNDALEETNKRIDRIEAILSCELCTEFELGITEAQIRANRLNEPQYYGGYKCFPNGVECVRLVIIE